MRGSKTKKQQQARPGGKGRTGAKGRPDGAGGPRRRRRTAAETTHGGYSVNALAKLLQRDRATIDRAVVGATPIHVLGRVKFYRLEEVEAKLKAKADPSLRDQKLIEEIRKLRVANDASDGKLVLKSKMTESMRRCLTPMAATLEQRLVNEYPTGVSGLDVPQARIYGKRLCDELMSFLQSFEREWT